MEAITRKKEVDEVIEIKKSIRALVRDRNEANTQWIVPTLGDPYPDEYRRLGGPSGRLFVYENEIDIAGLTSVQDKALQIANVQVYQSEAYACGIGISPINDVTPESKMIEWLFVTDTPFDVVNWYVGIDTNLLQYRIPSVFSDMSSATVKALSSDQVIFGRFRELGYTIDNQLNSAYVRGESFFGDAKQTMSSKLYVYRILFQIGQTIANFDQLRAPELELVINATTTELSDLEQIMELRRSYLTQQTIA